MFSKLRPLNKCWDLLNQIEERTMGLHPNEAGIDDNTGAIVLPGLEEELSATAEKQTTIQASAATNAAFPFKLDDLAYWVIKRKDGVVVKYTLVGPTKETKSVEDLNKWVKTNPQTSIATAKNDDYIKGKFSDWCVHYPKLVYKTDKVQLFIADVVGFKQDWGKFDFALDLGNIISQYQIDNGSVLYGDPALRELMEPYTTEGYNVRALKIDWTDRAAPPLDPAVWKVLAGQLSGRVLIACQGGHGRSGTALVCLMMALSDYTPYEAICHLRAVHCPRAIESKDQHLYIGEVGEELGRKNDVLEIASVKNFKEAFLKMKNPIAEPYQFALAAVKDDKK